MLHLTLKSLTGSSFKGASVKTFFFTWGLWCIEIRKSNPISKTVTQLKEEKIMVWEDT